MSTSINRFHVTVRKKQMKTQGCICCTGCSVPLVCRCGHVCDGWCGRCGVKEGHHEHQDVTSHVGRDCGLAGLFLHQPGVHLCCQHQQQWQLLRMHASCISMLVQRHSSADQNATRPEGGPLCHMSFELPRCAQVLITRQNDCILAETYMRLDHLETAMHNVRHEELINGIMMRLDHLSTDINHIKDHADDKVEETKKQAEFKQLVCTNSAVAALEYHNEQF
jgi:hypothetical protein